MPSTPTSAQERRAAAAGRCTPRRSRGTLKDGRRRPDALLKPQGIRRWLSQPAQSLEPSGFNFQTLLQPLGLWKGMP